MAAVLDYLGVASGESRLDPAKIDQAKDCS